MNLRLLAALLLGGAVAGCAQPTATVQATRSAAYAGAPKRVIVVDVFAKGSEGILKSLQQHFTDALKSCSVASETVEDQSVPLGGPAAPTQKLSAFVEARIAQQKPDSVLYIQQTWVQGRRTAAGIDPMNATYSLMLLEVATRRLVWQGTLDLQHAGAIGDAGAQLSEAIAGRMAQDRLLPGCPSRPAAAAPPPPPPSGDPLKDAAAARVRGDYDTAVALYRPLADQGNPTATARLADMYNIGQGVPKDDAESARWCATLADQGYKRLAIGFSNGQTITLCAGPAAKPPQPAPAH